MKSLKSFLRFLEFNGRFGIFAAKSERMSPKYKLEERLPHCLYCGEVISLSGGRPDRKFCSNECKNAFHNANRKISRQHYHDRIYRILENNCAILKHLLAMGVTSIDRRTLRELRFNQEFSTSYSKIGHRHHYTCFEIHYDITPTRAINIENILDRELE